MTIFPCHYCRQPVQPGHACVQAWIAFVENVLDYARRASNDHLEVVTPPAPYPRMAHDEFLQTMKLAGWELIERHHNYAPAVGYKFRRCEIELEFDWPDELDLDTLPRQ